jgi:hypothetical protein
MSVSGSRYGEMTGGRTLVRLLGSASVAALVLAAAAGCGDNKPAYDPGRQGVVSVEIGDWNPGQTVAPSQGWPWPNMTDVPPFPGTVDAGTSTLTGRVTVGAGGGSLTLTITGVSHEQFQAYAMLLRRSGYQVSGLNYYNSDPDAARARAARGDVDEVVATKGSRRLDIHAPSNGRVRFTIQGLTQAEVDALPTQNTGANLVVGASGETYLVSVRPIPTSTGISASHDWPAAWADRVPKPADCVIEANGVAAAGADMLYVTCAYTDTDTAKHEAALKTYEAQLVAAGYTLVSESKAAGGGVGVAILTKDTVTVTLMNAEPEGMIVSALQR